MLTRILLRLFLVAGLAVPLCAFALGIGPLEVRSSLNQTFEAEIPLIVSNPAELTGLTVQIPRQQDFDRAGVERLALFSKLRFSVRTSPGSPPVIRVTSLEPIREPNFHLLLELTWPRGRLIREFPVQLDPELYANRRPPPVAAPPVAAVLPVAVAPPPARTSPAVPVLPPAPPVSFEGASFYGPVKPGETLTAVARRVRPSPTLTIPQMMAILVAGNPEAFVGGNPNTLRAGTTLKVPNPQALGVPVASDPPPATPELAAISPPPPVQPTVVEPLSSTPPPDAATPLAVAEPAPSLSPPPAVVTTSPLPPAVETGPPLSPPALSPAEQPQEIIPQASIPQPIVAPPESPASTAPEPNPPPPVAIAPQPAPAPPVAKPPAPAPVADSEASWMDNPVVWIAIVLIVLAVGAVVLLPLLRRPALPKRAVMESEPAAAPEPADQSPAATTRTQIRDPRSARSQPVAGLAAAMAALRGIEAEAAPPSSQPTRVALSKSGGETSPASKPVITPAPKPIGDLLKDMDFGVNPDQTVVAGGKSATHDIKTPSFDAEPPTASVTRRPVNPSNPSLITSLDAAPPTETGVKRTASPPAPPPIEELPSELRLDGLDFDFGDFNLEETARRPQPVELPPLEISRNTPNVRPAELPPLELGNGQKNPTPPDTAKPALAKPKLEDLKFEFTDVSLEHSKASAPDESLRLDAELQDFGGDALLGKMAVESGGRAEAATDYVETKLDLATAYLDMGDQVGARNLLDEVLREGDAAQKQRAGELRKKLG